MPAANLTTKKHNLKTSYVISGRCTVPKEMVFYFAIYRTQSLSEPHRVFCGLYTVLVGKPEGKRQLGKPTRRWEDIRMALQEVGGGVMDWIELAQ